jgi:hypothetical protein
LPQGRDINGGVEENTVQGLLCPQAAKGIVNLEAYAPGGPTKPLMCCPSSAVTLIFVNDGIKRTLDGFGFGLRPQNLLSFFELGLIKDQVLVPTLVCSAIQPSHLMYRIAPYMYINKVESIAP